MNSAQLAFAYEIGSAKRPSRKPSVGWSARARASSSQTPIAVTPTRIGAEPGRCWVVARHGRVREERVDREVGERLVGARPRIRLDVRPQDGEEAPRDERTEGDERDEAGPSSRR